MAVGAGEEAPVDAADVVARHVGPVLGEVHAEAEVRRAVEPGEEAVDDHTREELQVPDPAQDGRVEKLCA